VWNILASLRFQQQMLPALQFHPQVNQQSSLQSVPPFSKRLRPCDQLYVHHRRHHSQTALRQRWHQQTALMKQNWRRWEIRLHKTRQYSRRRLLEHQLLLPSVNGLGRCCSVLALWQQQPSSSLERQFKIDMLEFRIEQHCMLFNQFVAECPKHTMTGVFITDVDCVLREYEASLANNDSDAIIKIIMILR